MKFELSKFICKCVAVATLTGFAVASASASVTWQEAADAGDSIATAQTPAGGGALSTIRGSIEANDVDIYRIFVTGGGTFSAATEGSELTDPQLFLFSADGRGVYANDDAGPRLQARLPAGNQLTPISSGIYYLAVSRFDRDAFSASGFIFPSSPYSPVYGPTGPGGGDALLGWTGSTSAVGTYEIALTGAQTADAPEPGSLALLSAGGALVAVGLRRRRRL